MQERNASFGRWLGRVFSPFLLVAVIIFSPHSTADLRVLEGSLDIRGATVTYRMTTPDTPGRYPAILFCNGQEDLQAYYSERGFVTMAIECEPIDRPLENEKGSPASLPLRREQIDRAVQFLMETGWVARGRILLAVPGRNGFVAIDQPSSKTVLRRLWM